MNFCPLVVVFLWWSVTVIVLCIYFKCFYSNKNGRNTYEGKCIYEQLPIVYDKCNGFSARHVYLMRLMYGGRNKRFFLPSATISIKFYDKNEKSISTVQIRSQVLTENHRRHLKQSSRTKQNSLFVLVKRRQALNNIKFILLNHNIHEGIIVMCNLFVLQLSDNSMYGSKIGKSIHSLEAGFDADTQTFAYAYFGKFNQYVGPHRNVTLYETFALFNVGLSTILLYCSSLILTPEWKMLRRYFASLADVFETSLFGGVLASLVFAVLICTYHFIFKRLNAKLQNVGCIWLVMKVLPFLCWLYSLLADLTALVVLFNKNSLNTDTQQAFWLISVLLATTIYTLAIFLVVLFLYLKGYYDEQELPLIEYDFDKTTSTPTNQEVVVPTSEISTDNKSDNYSTVNLILSSKLVEKETELGSPRAAVNTDTIVSISNVIDASFTSLNSKGVVIDKNEK